METFMQFGFGTLCTLSCVLLGDEIYKKFFKPQTDEAILDQAVKLVTKLEAQGTTLEQQCAATKKNLEAAKKKVKDLQPKTKTGNKSGSKAANPATTASPTGAVVRGKKVKGNKSEASKKTST